MSTSTARALLGSLVDYAGLFPPAELQMPAAVARYASCRSGSDAWMLGRFVLPLGRLGEFDRALGERPAGDRVTPWPLVVIGDGTLDADAKTIVGFNERRGREDGPDARIEAIDLKVGSLDDVARTADVQIGSVELFFEIGTGVDPSEMLAAVASVGGRAKIRTGGVTADLFPAARDLGRFLEVCAAEDVAFKATAGLHHPLRSAHQATADERAPTVMMHGFLNLFLAAILAYSHRARAESLESVLDEESPGAFVFDDAGVDVKGHRLACEEIASARESFALSFGSCSFDEPTSDLRRLGII